MARHKNLDVRVVLDTNALFVGSAHWFVRKEIADLIADYKSLPDITVNWYVPSIVRDERQYQMLSEAGRLHEHVQRLERLLGHNLNITPDILGKRVEDAIAKQIHDLGIRLIPLSTEKIDWQRLSADAVFRRPPFQVGDKEKGFRDALIVEAFMALKEDSPATPSSCRLALVSNDGLLRTAAQDRTVGAANIHVFASLDELRGLVNALSTNADETFIALLQPKADKLFYIPRDQSTLYYKWALQPQLDTALANATIALPPGATEYSVSGWQAGSPRYVKKDKTTITWTSRFTASIKATRPVTWNKQSIGERIFGGSETGESTNIFFKGLPQGGGLLDFGSTGSETLINQFKVPPSPIWPTWQAPEIVANGSAALDVIWAVNVTTTKALRTPTLKSVSFIDSSWD